MTIELGTSFTTPNGRVMHLALTPGGHIELSHQDDAGRTVSVVIPAPVIERLRSDQAARRLRQSLRSDTTQ
jgi:hypothetical protein